MEDFGPVRPEENPVFTQLETFPFSWGIFRDDARGSSYSCAIIFNMMRGGKVPPYPALIEGFPYRLPGVTLGEVEETNRRRPELKHLPLWVKRGHSGWFGVSIGIHQDPHSKALPSSQKTQPRSGPEHAGEVMLSLAWECLKIPE